MIRVQARVREITWDDDDHGGLSARELSTRMAGVGVMDRSTPLQERLVEGTWEGPEALSLTELRALVAHQVVAGGWTFRPVLSFARFLSG